MRILIVCLLSLIMCQCKSLENSASEDKTTFLALGDSYTIGEGVDEDGRWPNQLRDSLVRKGFNVKNPKIIATTGWRVDELLSATRARLDEDDKFDIVSVSIGVNNQYQKGSIQDYERDLIKMFELAISHSKRGSQGVFAVNIPDYGLSPMFAFRANKIAAEIDAFNEVFKKVASSFQIPVYDIHAVSKTVKDNASMFAADGLHPSEMQYTLWVQEILPKMSLMLK